MRDLSALGVVIAWFVFLIVMSVLGLKEIGSEKTIMQEAFERGCAVQCEGETGYYWSCDND